MRRRTFAALLAGAAVSASWPVRAQQRATRTRRIGVLLNLAADDPETLVRLAAFLQTLQELGWSEGRNLRIDYRWGVGDAERHRANAAELAALGPDVILAHGSTIMRPLQRQTRTIPIVFVSTADPVSGGFVESLAHPGGNATGFTSSDYGMSGKWAELLKDIAPRIKRIGVLRDPDQVSGNGQLGAIQAVAPLLGVEMTPLACRDAGEIEHGITAFASRPDGGLIATTSAFAQIQRPLIVGLTAKYKLPAIYPYRLFVRSGGLMSFGPDVTDQYRRAASYIDRILKGEKPGELPVQQPSKYELAVNMKTARALGLEVPASFAARGADLID